MRTGRPFAGEWCRDLLDLFLPAGCLGCGERIPPGRPHPRVCGVCRSRLRSVPWPRCRRCHMPLGTGGSVEEGCEECRTWPPILAGARSAVVLEPPADRLVHALKYDGWRELAPLMARRMAGLSSPPGPGWDGVPVVPVPTTRKRRRRRGYNQAAVLASALSAELDRPLVNALERRDGDRTQVVLHPTQRRANVRTAFTARTSAAAAVAGGRVLLVDDVLTTGGTAHAAAQALRGAGAAAIALATLARAGDHRLGPPGTDGRVRSGQT